MDDLSMALVWIAFFASIFFGWYFYLQARNKERMALIEKNVDVSEIFKKREVKFRFPWLKLGMIVLGMGVGIFVSAIVIPLSDFEPEEVLVIGCLMFFGALGLIIAYFIDNRNEN